MGCCASSKECETRRVPVPNRSRDCSEVICCDDSPTPTQPVPTDLIDLARYDELVLNASKTAKTMDEHLENQYKNMYNSILHPREYLNAEPASPDTFYLSSDADADTEGYFCNRSRTYSESKAQSFSSISNSISGNLGRV